MLQESKFDNLINNMTMTRSEIENELDKLYKNLEIAHNADEETVCRLFNTDSKNEIIKVITDEIDTYEDLLKEFDIPEDDGMDYIGLQLSQGLPVVYWQ